MHPFVPKRKTWHYTSVVEHEHNFFKFYQLTISFLVPHPQFCTLESSLCVSSGDYWLIISPFGNSFIKVVLQSQNSHYRTHSSNHISTQNELMIDNNEDPCADFDGLRTEELNKRAIQERKAIQNNTVLEPWIPILYIALSTGVRSSLNSDYIDQSLGLQYHIYFTN